MCSIFGILGEYDLEKALRASDAMRHRGPHSSGYWAGERIFLAHNRLAIVDPSSASDQPIANERAVLVFNGEIYNYKELRDRLPYSFVTGGDTETVLAAYESERERFLEILDGMYALALYDRKREKLYLARDIFGKKPLFFFKDKSRFVFSSELRALFHFCDKRFCEDTLSSYLSFGSALCERTFYEGIYRIKPGTMLVVEKGSVREKESLFLREKETIKDENRAVGAVKSALFESVERRLQGQKPIAFLLSGGIDSSLIAAMASRLRGKIDTFTIGYEGYKKHDESPFAQMVSKTIRSDHRRVVYDKRLFLEGLERLFFALEEPLGDPASAPLEYLFSKISSQGFEVVLGGEGGDEIFLGYGRYREFADIEKAAGLKYKNWLRNYFKRHYSPNKEWEWYKRVFEGSWLFRGSSEIFTDLQKGFVLRRPVKDNDSLKFMECYIKRARNFKEPLKRYTVVDMGVRLSDLYLRKLDRVSMINSIEARTPMLDRNLAELALSIDGDLHLKGGSTKYILKKVAEEFLAPEILNRRKKGFSFPFMEWLLESGEFDRAIKINEGCDIFRRETLNELKRQLKRRRFSMHGWLIYSFLVWFEREFM